MSVADFERGLPVEEYVRMTRKPEVPTSAEEKEEDFGIRDEGDCGSFCQRITDAFTRADADASGGGKRKTRRKRRRKRRKKSRKKRKRKTRRKLRKRKKKTKRRRRR
tara:strand:- start:2551 stop:2871 length:321 start_codon:yes stop_codon:yes gene_type:complete